MKTARENAPAIIDAGTGYAGIDVGVQTDAVYDVTNVREETPPFFRDADKAFFQNVDIEKMIHDYFS